MLGALLKLGEAGELVSGLFVLQSVNLDQDRQVALNDKRVLRV